MKQDKSEQFKHINYIQNMNNLIQDINRKDNINNNKIQSQIK